MSASLALPTSLRPFVPPPPPKTPKSAVTRRRLLEIASQLFIDRGYEAVSLRDIAVAANLTKGAVYGHFHSKGQLLVEVIRWKIAERDQVIDYIEARGDPARGVELMHDEIGRDCRLLEVDAAAAARHDPEVAAGLRDLYLDRNDRIRDAMSELADPDAAAWVVSALTAGIGMRESAGLPPPSTDRLTATILAAISGLADQNEVD